MPEIQEKFVIWGIGKRGKWLFSLLGQERVIAIIDNDKEKQGKEYEGIPVVSYDEYLKELKNYPVIVSPKGNAEIEIMKQLHKDGIVWAFAFSKELLGIEGFLRQCSPEDILKDYKKDDQVILCGFNVLSIIVYRLLRDKGCNCSIYVGDESAIVRQYIKNVLQFEIVDNAMPDKGDVKIILSEDNGQWKEMVCAEKNVHCIYNLGLQKELFYYPELEKFKDIHKGKRCFIVATGPSLRMEDLELLHRNKEICISVNGIFKAFDKTKWRPDYYTIGDAGGVLCWKREILNMDVKYKFVSDQGWIFGEEEKRKSNLYKWHFYRIWDDELLPEFSDDFAKGAYHGWTVVYTPALQLAAYMGFSEIYLLGTDCSQQDTVSTVHFYDDSDNKNEQGYLRTDKIFMAYHAAKNYAATHNLKIYNATRGGALEIFERVEFDSLFNK